MFERAPRPLLLATALLALVLLAPSCAHRQAAATDTWREKGLTPSSSTADAIEASFGPRRVALLIGIGEYEDHLFPPLVHAANDAAEFGEVLEANEYGGFDRVITLTSPVQTTQSRILTELVSLRNDLRSQDTLVVYFSGHGTMRLNDRDEPTLYLVASDTQARDLAGTAVELAEVQGFFTRIRAERKALIIDACFHGEGKSAVQPTIRQRIDSMDVYPTLSRRVKLGQSEAHLFATSWGRPAREDDTLSHGVYTYFLLQGLTWNQDDADANDDALVTIYEAHDFARGQTVAFTNGAQVPEAYFRVVGEKDLVVAGEPEKRLESQLALIYYYDTADSAFIGARLDVDGRFKGMFPGSIPVDPGRHRITITSPEGSVLFDRVIDIDYQESIAADAVNRREPVSRGYLALAGGPAFALGEGLPDLVGPVSAGPQLNLGLRFRDPALTGLSLSAQVGYLPANTVVERPDGAVVSHPRHVIQLGGGIGGRMSSRVFALGFHWRLRAEFLTAAGGDGCPTSEAACDGWVVFSQGAYVEQVFRLSRLLNLVVGEELMGAVVDPEGTGVPGMSFQPRLMVGLELNL